MKKLMKSVLACLLAFAMVLTVMPVNSYAAAKKSVVVTNQKQLEKALKNGATNIVIKTNKNVKITIPATKKAAKASISVQAKNATITNKASVKSIVIKDAKAFVESGKNNDIKITDSKLSLTVAKESKGADIRVAKKDAEIKVVAKGDVASVTVAKTADVILTVNKTATVDSVNVVAKGASVDLNAKGTVSDVKVSEKAADTKLNINASGKVENVQIDAKADVAVAGSTTEAVKVTVNAKDTTIKAETAVETTLNADAKVDLSKGAEGSKVTTAENVKVDVANNTEDKVIVTDSTGKETSVDAGKTETTKDESKKDDEKKDDQKKDDQSSGGSSGGSSGTVTPTPTPTPSEPEVTAKMPELPWILKKSVVLKCSKDYEYACVDAGTATENIATDQWLRLWEQSDDYNNYEIKGLDSSKSYWLYARLIDNKKVCTYKEFTTTNTDVVCKAEAIGTTEYNVENTVCAGDTVEFSMDVDTYAYGYENKQGLHGSVELSCDDKNLEELLNDEEWGWEDDESDDMNFFFTVPNGLATGAYVVKFKYYFEYNGMKEDGSSWDEEKAIAKSEPVTYTIKFNYKSDEDIELVKPNVLYVLKNSIVIKTEPGMWYACVEEGENAPEWNEKDSTWERWSDDFGNMEFSGLKADTTYRVYARKSFDNMSEDTDVEMLSSDPVKTKSESQDPVVKVSASGEKNITLTEKVTAGATIYVPILNLKAACYGVPEGYTDGISVNYTTIADEEIDVSVQGMLNNVYWQIELPKNLVAGTYSISLSYRYGCLLKTDDVEKPLSMSEPINYTVTFTVE